MSVKIGQNMYTGAVIGASQQYLRKEGLLNLERLNRIMAKPALLAMNYLMLLCVLEFLV